MRSLFAVRWVPSRPFRQDQPTAYRVLKSDLFKRLGLKKGKEIETVKEKDRKEKGPYHRFVVLSCLPRC